MVDEAVRVVGVGVEAMFEVLGAEEEALGETAAVPAYDFVVGGEVGCCGVEDAAAAVCAGDEQEKRAGAEGLVVEDSAWNFECGHRIIDNGKDKEGLKV